MSVRFAGGTAFLAEIGRQVGTGHLKECLRIAAALREQGTHVSVWTVGCPPKSLSVGISGSIRNSRPPTISRWARAVRASGHRVALLNLWDCRRPQCKAVAASGLRLVVFDERGGKTLPADAIVNPLLLPRAHRYGGKAKRFLGPRYLPMRSPSMSPPRPSRGPVRRVLITFGGADRTGATLCAISALSSLAEVSVRVVLGPGFNRHAAATAAVSAAPKGQFHVFTGVKDLTPHLLWSDVVINSGGNTLCEAASLGRPAIIAHEDPHELAHGRAFERRGFGICVGRGVTLRAPVLRRALRRLNSPSVRQRMASVGRRIVDGRGTRRIVDLMYGLSQ